MSRSGSSPTTPVPGSSTATSTGTWARTCFHLIRSFSINHSNRADLILPPLSGFAVVFVEDVPDVPEVDFVTGAFANFGIWMHNDSHNPKYVLDAWRNLCPTYNAFVNKTSY